MRGLFLLLTILATTCYSYTAQGQAPGYLGKKLFLNIDCDVAPNFSSLRSQMSLTRRLGLKPAIQLGYTVGTQTAITFRVSGTNYIYPLYNNYNTDNGSSPDLPYGEDLTNPDYRTFRKPLSANLYTSVMQYDFTVQFYDGSFIAPAGAYFELLMGLSVINTNFLDIDNKRLMIYSDLTNNKLLSPRIGMAHMRNMIVFDRLLLRYGYEFGFDFMGMWAFTAFSTNVASSFTNKNFLRYEGAMHNTAYTFFNFRVGIGIIN
ncbi:hypothetical protein GC194_12580 [bacterium]|nr:hypothetical protein [bacterium]